MRWYEKSTNDISEDILKVVPHHFDLFFVNVNVRIVVSTEIPKFGQVCFKVASRVQQTTMMVVSSFEEVRGVSLKLDLSF